MKDQRYEKIETHEYPETGHWSDNQWAARGMSKDEHVIFTTTVYADDEYEAVRQLLEAK